VILDFYYRMPEPAHTDSHPECQHFSKLLGRSPGTVDSSLRNLKTIDQGPGLSHIATTGIEVYREFAGRPRSELQSEAVRALARIRGAAGHRA
jgi:hypothetical protein